MALTGINNFCGIKNLSGIKIIEYVPTAWINLNAYAPLISSGWNWQLDILFDQGGWMKAPVLPDPKLWTETQKRNPQGKYYEQLVRGVIPNLLPAVSGEFDEMANYYFLLRIEDVKGRKWILGTVDSPFEFLADGTTGDNGGLKHHAIRFVSQTAHKAYGFEPV